MTLNLSSQYFVFAQEVEMCSLGSWYHRKRKMSPFSIEFLIYSAFIQLKDLPLQTNEKDA